MVFILFVLYMDWRGTLTVVMEKSIAGVRNEEGGKDVSSSWTDEDLMHCRGREGYVLE